ncbi:alanine racemase [Granulicella sibirica]|uniref:Alanine racemase n=1 Tax=Granulicella sibirica TaxID=2479048 RepID=A0A4Q0T8R6_9BACT|nr:alanine racemase [Granulicella sibirica]RXH58558.1 Alanine racemase [Granulicella sibirica]
MKSIIEVSEQRLRANVQALERALHHADSPIALLAVIKANAYGHGAEICAPMLARAGVPWLGVTDACEGASVRAALPAGSAPEILIMSGPPGDDLSARNAADLALSNRLTPVLWTPEQLIPIAEAAKLSGVAHQIHLEIDTGMSRQGGSPGQALETFLQELNHHHQSIRLDGVFTHFASAECADARQTLAQMSVFEKAIESIAAAGHSPRWLHIGNTSTIDNATEAATPILDRLRRLAASIGARPMARSGLGLYGLSLPLEPDQPGATRIHQDLQPVLTWKTTVTSVHEIPPGARVGYSATFTASRPMRLALLPIGYADGLRRDLSSTEARMGGWVMIQGRRAPIVGRISMNLTTVDVTGIPEVRRGDFVTLIGEGISAEDHARLAHTIPYEILCGLRGTPRALLLPPAPR